MPTAKARVDHLRETLVQHNSNYAQGRPEISDEAYDKLYRELLELEKANPQLQDVNSPTAKIGVGEVESFTRSKHSVPMLGLDNVFTEKELELFFKEYPPRTEFVVEPKFDGVSLSLIYEGSELVQALTRGDGAEGDDVTHNARALIGVPLKLSVMPFNRRTVIRGEVVMYNSVFRSINKARIADGEEPFANARNAAAGTMKQLDSREVYHRKLVFIAHRVADAKFEFHDDAFTVLKDVGFYTSRNFPAQFGKPPSEGLAVCHNLEEVMTVVKAFNRFRKDMDLDFDGMVVKLRSISLQKEAGDGRRSPKWACAWKYPPEQVKTILRGITCQVGRTGIITPVAELVPVNIGGAMVARASLCNEDEVDRLDVAVGDEVFVVRAGEVIPKILGVSQKRGGKAWKMPEICPCCGSKLIRAEGFVAWRCVNAGSCRSQIKENILHAVGRPALDWDGLGEEHVAMLVDQGRVKTLADLFTLPESTVKHLFKPASATKFLSERVRLKSADLWRKLHALGIESVGKSISQDLAARYSSASDILAAGEPSLAALIGPVKARAFFAFFRSHIDELERLEESGFLLEGDVKTGSLTGKTFCITGAMVSGSRDEVGARIIEKGGIVKSSVSSSVNFLVMGDGAGANKQEAARKKGTTIITEEELYEMMGETMPVGDSVPADFEP